MNPLRTPKQKLIAASAALALFLVLAGAQGASPTVVARLVLAGLVAAALGWWAIRARQTAPRFQLPPRLEVVSRAGLSQRCSVALIEADGRSYVIAYGDGFAEIHAERPPPRAQARRPRRRPLKAAGAGR